MKSYIVTIQVKAIEQYFVILLFIVLYKVVLSRGFRWNHNVNINCLFFGQFFHARGV